MPQRGLLNGQREEGGGGVGSSGRLIVVYFSRTPEAGVLINREGFYFSLFFGTAKMGKIQGGVYIFEHLGLLF